MKKKITKLCWLQLILTAILPAGILISSLFGYSFQLVSAPAFGAALAIVSGCMVVICLKYKEATQIREIQILTPVAGMLSFINAFFYIFSAHTILVAACVFVCCGCSFFLTAKYGKPLALKITALVLSVLLTILLGFFSFIALVFGNIGQNTIVKTIPSPDGKYYAQVIDSDQGALGGDTLVDVYEDKCINGLLFKIEKKPQRVYCGQWGEFRDMEIHWKNDTCLVINSVEYTIEK